MKTSLTASAAASWARSACILALTLTLVNCTFAKPRKSHSKKTQPSSTRTEDSQRDEQQVASYLYCVTDDFVVDVYINGERLPDSKRKLLVEKFGATAERINMPIQSGDWIVFNVVNNRLRWGGAYYFAVAGIAADESTIALQSSLTDGNWCSCDNPANVSKFISDREFLKSNSVHQVSRIWKDGTPLMKRFAPSFDGAPIWGGSRNTWIKYRVP